MKEYLERYADVLYKEKKPGLILEVHTLLVSEEDSQQDICEFLQRSGSWSERDIIDVDFFVVDQRGQTSKRRYVGIDPIAEKKQLTTKNTTYSMNV